MDRRSFLKSSGMIASGWASAVGILPVLTPLKLLAAEGGMVADNPNLADPALGATVTASSFNPITTFSYPPTQAFGDILTSNWETGKEAQGAWLEISWPEEKTVAEIWLLPKPLPYDIVYDPYSRGGKMQTPRRVECSAGGGNTVNVELRDADYFQIITFPEAQRTKTIRITIDEIWPEANREGTGLGKVRVFSRLHVRSFDLWAHAMYDVHGGVPVQAATISAINPVAEVRGAQLRISRAGKLMMTIPLDSIPAQAAPRQHIWIPAPYDDADFDFSISESTSGFDVTTKIHVPAYHSYFDGGTFDLLVTNHNDLGWLDTQKVTANYRSAELILPAMEIIKKHPEFRYSMEAVIYLVEFLERHPEKRDEMARLMRERKFVWGASYVENLEVHVGPEKLVRQFYLGRRWLRKNFPGCDSVHYRKTDPPSMTLQMPQILSRAGVKYALQGRFPWGFYNWEAPDGSKVFVFALRYSSPYIVDPESNEGWLQFAREREPYYAPRNLPRQMIFDFNGDYIPPPPTLPAYVQEQNAAMKRFADAWNSHYRGQPDRQITPPVVRFVEAEGTLREFEGKRPNLTTLTGDWPCNWVYYDEPAHRAGLLAGRHGHNHILAAERLFAGLLQQDPSTPYPTKTIEEAWRANCWPDHGWGGNKGVLTDSIYVESYQKSQTIGNQLLADATTRLAHGIARAVAGRPAVAVYNPLSWPRTDVVHCRVQIPSGWSSFRLRDSSGAEVPFQMTGSAADASPKITFIAQDVPSVGYRTYHLERATSAPPAPDKFTGGVLENDFLRAVIGPGGLISLHDKRLKQEILRTEKFLGGEVLEFTAPGTAWDDLLQVTTEGLEKTSHYTFAAVNEQRGPVFTAATHEAQFKHFRLRQTFRLFSRLDRVEMDLEILDWNGAPSRELRVAFPINLPQDFRLSYEVPFGTVEFGTNELDFSLLPPRAPGIFNSRIYGGDQPLPFREAINWIDASADRYDKWGCLASSDCSVHLFADQTENPMNYPVLQHVLLSTRESLAWNPGYYFTQPGNHSFRIALHPHPGGWRDRYRDGIAFNFPLIAFMTEVPANTGSQSWASGEFLRLEPENLIMTALKKSEDDNSLALRFYEAEGRFSEARIKLAKPIRQAWMTNLIEEEAKPLPVNSQGVVELKVKPWEILTLRLEV